MFGGIKMSTLQIELFSKKESGLDGLRREDFPSEEAFIEAGIARQMRLNDPAYRKARLIVSFPEYRAVNSFFHAVVLPYPNISCSSAVLNGTPHLFFWPVARIL